MDEKRSSDSPSGIAEYGNKFGITLTFGVDQIGIRKSDREIQIDAKHEVYLSDMINYFDYYHGAVIPTMIDGVAVVNYSLPALHRLARSGVEFEFPSLPESDESTECYLKALALQPGEVVFDFGAYAGASAYFFSKAVGSDGIVISFEPDEINFRYLKTNIARHLLSNVQPVDKGVWSETARLEFQAEGNMGSSAVAFTGRKSNLKIVDVLSLKDAAELVGGRRVAAIKMDIEGAEVAVLRSAADFLRRHRPRLIIEPHNIDGRMVTDEVCQILRDNRYSVEVLSQGSQSWPLIAGLPVPSV